MAHRTGVAHACVPQGLCVEDLKLARWFLHVVVNECREHSRQAGRPDDGKLNSHAIDLEEPDGKGRRKLGSLADVFHDDGPTVPMSDILTALARVGFIMPPQQTTESATDTESGGYTFRLTGDLGQFPPPALRSARAKPGAVRKDTAFVGKLAEARWQRVRARVKTADCVANFA
jgi:hypothetical protein